MIRRPPRSTQSRSSAASDVYKRQVEVRREADLEDVDQPVDRAGGARAHEDDHVLVGGPDGPPDQLARLRPEAGRLEAGPAGLRVRVRICLLYTSDAADDLLCVDLG